MNQNKAKVSIRKCSAYDVSLMTTLIRDCINDLGGLKNLIPHEKINECNINNIKNNSNNFKKNKNLTILLKPNLLSANPPEKAITTHPKFIESIINVLNDYFNCSVKSNIKIVIADSPGVSISHTKKDLEKLYNKCGFSYLAQLENVSLSYDEEIMTVSYKEGFQLKQFHLIKPALEADLIINIPKFKTHSLTKITGAVKNMYGLIHGKTKTLLHTKFLNIEKFCNMNLDIYLYAKPVLNIMDGIIGLEGEGPGSSGKHRKIGLIIASNNGVALDNVVSYIMGYPVKKNLLNKINEDDEQLNNNGNINKIKNSLDKNKRKNQINTIPPVLICALKRNLEGSNFDKIEIFDENGKLINIDNYLIKDYILPKESIVNNITNNPFLNNYLLPFMRNSLSLSPYQNEQKCNMCQICIKICPQKAIDVNESREDKLKFDYKKCIRCYCCSEMCPQGAIDLKYSFIGSLFFGRKNVK